MKILICGNGKGSFEMRAIQLGAAIGARVTSSPTDEDFHWCDLAVLVKKHAVHFAYRAHKAGKPIVWDALDFWSQPAQNHYTRDAALLALRSTAKVINPALIIGATKAMADDAASLGFTSAYLPHHSWSGLVPTPPREQVSVVGYQGNPSYLGRWHGWLTEACQRRGWSFVVNPPDLSAVDILVAFRDGAWDGWICREWKSGVKVVNAIAAGRPLIGQASAAVTEILTAQANRPVWECAESSTQINAALDAWAPITARQLARDETARLAPSLTLDAVAARYRSILSTVEMPCATA